MRWWPWRRAVERSSDAVRAAEELRDRAQAQQRRVQAITPRVDAATESLRHVGPMIENILRSTR